MKNALFIILIFLSSITITFGASKGIKECQRVNRLDVSGQLYQLITKQSDITRWLCITSSELDDAIARNDKMKEKSCRRAATVMYQVLKKSGRNTVNWKKNYCGN